jgi:hypothetical protein
MVTSVSEKMTMNRKLPTIYVAINLMPKIIMENGRISRNSQQSLSERFTDFFAYAGLDSDAVYPVFKIRAF